MEHTFQLLVVMLVYVTFLVIWGVYQGRKVKNCCDYAIAGRNLPGWAAALSERATGESSWALLGLPERLMQQVFLRYGLLSDVFQA